MMTCPILAIPDFSQPFVVECDASSLGIRAILMQKRRPIAFESTKLSAIEKTFSIYEQEMLALSKFR